jgi:hypothetical protein
MKSYQLKPGLEDVCLKPGMTEKAYRKLRDAWYLKLKKAGFSDIEFGVNGKGAAQLPWPHGTISAPKRRTNRTVDVNLELSDERAQADFSDTYDYWTMCRQFLHAGRAAPHGDERRIWSLYSEGYKGREISRELRIPNSTVQRTIHRCEAAMHLWWQNTAAEREAERDARETLSESDVPVYLLLLQCSASAEKV